jgi:hypothetical protein
VVEDERKRPTAPHVALPADLAQRLFDALTEETALEMASVVGRPFDQQLAQWSRRAIEALAPDRIGIEVARVDPPAGDVLLDRGVVSAGRTEPQTAQHVADRSRGSDNFTQLRFAVHNPSRHEHMFASVRDGT